MNPAHQAESPHTRALAAARPPARPPATVTTDSDEARITHIDAVTMSPHVLERGA